jgi:hypothetical protein
MMNTDITQDVRYLGVSETGRDELKTYLDWISEHQLSDSEASFIYFAIGRAGLASDRHLFAIWQEICEGMEVDTATILHTMRFFLNPTEASFAVESTAGWFDFIPQVYELVASVEAPTELSVPTFTKVTDETVVALKEAAFKRTNERVNKAQGSIAVKSSSASAPQTGSVVTLKGWGIGVMHFSTTREQLAQMLNAYNEDGANGALTYLFSQCPQDRMIEYFMGMDDGLSVDGTSIKDMTHRRSFFIKDFASELNNGQNTSGTGEFYCLLYSPDMTGHFTLPTGTSFDPNLLKVTSAQYNIAEQHFAVALEGDLVNYLEYQGQTVDLHCTPHDYTYYGKLFTQDSSYYQTEPYPCVFQSNTETGQWELAREKVLLILNG